MDQQEPNKMNASEKLEEVQSELRCTICHDYFVQASTLSCSHSFCFNCINAWRQTHSDCPVCRRNILGMAPSRALDNMVAALGNCTNSEAAAQASLQQFGVWINPVNGAQQNNRSSNVQQDTQESSDSDDWGEYEDDEDGEDSYSGGDYDAEEEEDDAEEEEEEDLEEEEDEEEDSSSDYDDDMDSDCSDEDEYDEEHANKSNRNNPNNDEYWRLRGWSSRPTNWKELIDRQ